MTAANDNGAPTFGEQLAAWEAWANPTTPSSMRDEPALHRLRERWPVDGGGEGPADMAALFAEWKATAGGGAP